MISAQTIEDILSAFVLTSGAPPGWPPNMFAAVGTILKRSGAYTEVVHRWPPRRQKLAMWHANTRDIAKRWRVDCLSDRMPVEVHAWWAEVMHARKVPLSNVRGNRRAINALLNLCAVADEASAGLGFLGAELVDGVYWKAVDLLEFNGSLCTIADPEQIRVLPKAHNPFDGLTFRSLTHHLALWANPEVHAAWKSAPMAHIADELNVLLLPWPLFVEPRAFQKVRDDLAADMPPEFGMFAYEPPAMIDVPRVRAAVRTARRLVGDVHAIVLPELSMEKTQFERLRDAFDDLLIIAGVGVTAKGALGRNEVAISQAFWTASADEQSKHHRWRLDPAQFGNYGLRKEFSEKSSWWEAIDLPPRRCTFFNVNEWLTFSVLICEDLARQDPIAELVRTVGPSLVVALLMDGPQLADRWSARYATVLAEDPRSSVLTLTSAGMVDLSNSQFGGGSPRSIALWRDAVSGIRQIHLQEGADGVVIRLSKRMETEWTADGRNDAKSTGYVVLNGVFQVFPTAGATTGSHSAVSRVARRTGARRGPPSKRGTSPRKGK